MHFLNKYKKLLDLLLPLLSLFTLLLACYVPLHIDDIMILIVLARAKYDGWVSIGVWAVCDSNSSVKIPVTLIPGRALAWLFYYFASTPWTIRIWGVTSFVLWIAGLAGMFKRCFPETTQNGRAWTFILALSFLGTIPLMAVFVRPEPFLALAVGFYALLPFSLRKKAVEGFRYPIVVVIFLLITSWCFATHPKFLFFTPLIGYAFWSLRKNSLLYWAGAGGLLFTLYQSYFFWVAKFDCHDNKAIAEHMKTRVLDPQMLFYDPIGFLSSFFHSLGTLLFFIVFSIFTPQHVMSLNAFFTPQHLLGWLPDVQTTIFHQVANVLIGCFFFGTLLYWGIAVLQVIRTAIKNHAYFSPDFAVPFFLLSSIIVIAGLQTTWFFYDTLFFWFLGICLTGIFWFHMPLLLSSQTQKYVAVIVITVCCFSQVLLLKTYYNLPEILQSADSNGQLPKIAQETARNTYPNQSFSQWNYGAQKEQILHFAEQCHITPTPDSNHVAIDYYTYLPFIDTHQPIYVHPEFMQDIKKEEFLSFLRKRNAGGLVALCRSLPPNLQPLTHQQDGLCCIEPQTIKEAR